MRLDGPPQRRKVEQGQMTELEPGGAGAVERAGASQCRTEGYRSLVLSLFPSSGEEGGLKGRGRQGQWGMKPWG